MIIYGPWKIRQFYTDYYERNLIYSDEKDVKSDKTITAYLTISNDYYISVSRDKNFDSLKEAKDRVDNYLCGEGCILINNEEDLKRYLVLL